MNYDAAQSILTQTFSLTALIASLTLVYLFACQITSKEDLGALERHTEATEKIMANVYANEEDEFMSPFHNGEEYEVYTRILEANCEPKYTAYDEYMNEIGTFYAPQVATVFLHEGPYVASHESVSDKRGAEAEALMFLTIRQLKSLAKEYKVKYYGVMTKQQLAESLACVYHPEV